LIKWSVISIKEDMRMTTKQKATFQGNPLTLIGNEVRVGEIAPDFQVLANDLKPVRLSDYKGKICVISAVPSLDTPVCDAQTRRFNVEAGRLGEDVQILTVSMDLPFAQGRWCGAAGVDKVKTVSDHRDASFGEAYGMLIQELRLLARGVFIVDRDGKLRYTQYVTEITQEPDYQDVLRALKQIS
jgi:thioredoxin-dependent peroxiredoxin